MSDDLKRRIYSRYWPGVKLQIFLISDVFDNFPRIFISCFDSCVPSDCCKSYGCSTSWAMFF
jgi:hypothetical protein